MLFSVQTMSKKNLCRLSTSSCMTIIAGAPWSYQIAEGTRTKEDIYEDLPLFVIEQNYGSTEAGKTLVSKTLKTIMFVFVDDCIAASLVMQPWFSDQSHDDLASVLCDVSRAYIKRITDSQKGKPHVQESDLQEACTPFCFASLHVWYCASFLWHLVILCGTPVCSFPSTLMTHDSVSTESGKRWREQAPWH